MEDKNEKQKVVVIALIKNSAGQILLQKRRDAINAGADGKWEFPGGLVDFGEAPEEAIVRECKEEIGCKIEVVRLLPYLHTKVWQRANGELVQAFVSCFEARIADGVLQSLDGASSAVQWYTKEEALALDTLPGIKEFVELVD